MSRIPFFLLLAFMLSACSFQSNNEINSQEIITSLEKQVADLQEEINELKAQNNSEFLPVYGLDQALNDEEIQFYFSVDSSLSLEQKIAHLANELSRFKFSGLPIRLQSIEEIDGKQVAHINLEEMEGATSSWRTGYFQGSTGAHATYISLVKTLLQPEYQGQWVDGLQFLYQGQPMEPWDHIDLSATLWRENIE